MASLLPIMLEKLLPMLTSSSSMIRKEIIDLVLELSHYRDCAYRLPHIFLVLITDYRHWKSSVQGI